MTNKTLLTFLGRGRVEETNKSRYQKIIYDLPLNKEPTSYFAFALLKEFVARGEPFDRVVVLGTNGSSWDDLLVTLGGWDDDAPGTISLRNAAAKNSVQAADLAPVSQALTRCCKHPFECLLIPTCVTEQEALSVVRLIADQVGPGDRVTFDVTHGYRHLPLIALAALSLVEVAKEAEIEGVYYGAAEMGRGLPAAPVLDLSGYMTLLRWTRGLAAFDASGDPTPIARLIEGETKVPVTADLVAATYRERMLDVDAVRTPWNRARDALRRDLGVGSLFRQSLEERFAWTENDLLSQRQLALAWEAARQRDLLRSTLLLFEAAISDAIERQGDRAAIMERAVRERTRDEMALRNTSFDNLRALRNALAHPGRGSGTGRTSALASPQRTVETLVRLAKALFPMQAKQWSQLLTPPPG